MVPYEVIWRVNWLHYLNYEPIACTSSTRNLVLTRNVLCQTVSSYGWCNVIPRFVPLFRLFSEKFASDHLSYRRQEILPRVDLVLRAFGEHLHVCPSFLSTGFHVPPLSYLLNYCFGICVSVCTYDINSDFFNIKIWKFNTLCTWWYATLLYLIVPVLVLWLQIRYTWHTLVYTIRSTLYDNSTCNN